MVDWAADRAAIDRALETLCDTLAGVLDDDVGDAVRYSVLGGGKRLRGLLFLGAYRTARGELDASALAAELEGRK